MTILNSLHRAAGALRRIARGDSWINNTTGQGQGTGRSAWEYQRANLIPYQVLSDLYHGDAYAAKVCEAHPEHAIRRGFTVTTGDKAVDKVLLASCEDMALARRASEAWTWGRAFGGGALVLGCDDGRKAQDPLDLSTLRAVRFVTTVDSSELVPDTWETDPLSPRFGEPRVYRLQRSGGGGGMDTSQVHHTRVVRFEGLPTTRPERQRLNGWGASVLARTYDLLQQWNGGHVAVNDLLLDASQAVWKVKGLLDIVSGDAAELFEERMALADRVRSTFRAVLLDTEESLERTEVGALTGLPDLLDRYALRVAGASGIPVSILLGRSPAGLNATGESDTRGFYDDVSAKRERVLRPALEHVVRLILLSSEGPTRGKEPAGWRVEFPPLWEPTEGEKADLRLKVAQTDAVYLTNGVTTPEEVAASRFPAGGEWSMDTTVDLGARAPLEEPPATDGAPKTDATDVDLTPTEEMADAARRALEVRAEKPESQRGMEAVGIARARDLANRRTLSPETVREMVGWFARHETDKDGETWGDKGPGWQAWNGWGGDPGRAWAERKVAELDRAAEAA